MGFPRHSAALLVPKSAILDGAGGYYALEVYRQRVRHVNASGIISTVLGNGTAGFVGDGFAATSALISFPVNPSFAPGNSIAALGTQGFYIFDLLNSRLRKVSNGIISTVAGNGSTFAFGDGVLGTAASFGAVSSIDVDSLGGVWPCGSSTSLQRPSPSCVDSTPGAL
jgi:trimeric autotransporter adhesin